MRLPLSLLIISMLLELCLHTTFGWQVRKGLSFLIVLFLSLGTGGFVVIRPSFGTFLLFIGTCYRIFNMTRLVKERIDLTYLQRITKQTSLWLMGLQLLTIILSYTLRYGLSIKTNTWLYIFGVAQLVLSLTVFVYIRRQLRTTAPIEFKKGYSSEDLPSITVAIPARNEDEDLEACIQSVLASDYPKLEILVLDDCSQDDTPQIIRGFAHDGVRFIAGAEPRDSWLAKNQAYERLVEEASGEVILFCGVDVRFEPHSIRELVMTMLHKKKQMISVLPLSHQMNRLPIVQSIRYYWEMAPLRRIFNRPPVLSTCWLISSDALQRIGGFKGERRSVVPEALFARELARDHDSYRFMRSDARLGVASVKSNALQMETAVRMRYPQLHRRPELVLLTSLLELGVLCGPYIIAIANIWFRAGWILEGITVSAAVIFCLGYAQLSTRIFSRSTWLAYIAFPYTILTDIGLLHYSMWKYEFSEVVWKGRNVCLPVMRVISRLPPME